MSLRRRIPLKGSVANGRASSLSSAGCLIPLPTPLPSVLPVPALVICDCPPECEYAVCEDLLDFMRVSLAAVVVVVAVEAPPKKTLRAVAPAPPSPSWSRSRPRAPKRRGNQDLRSGRSAGADAVMMAKFVSIADVANPILPSGSGLPGKPNNPFTRSAIRTMLAIVVLF